MELTPDLQSAAELQLGETIERREASLAELKQLLASNNHSSSSTAPAAGYIKALLDSLEETGLATDDVLLQHLRARKFDVAKASKSLSLRAAFLQEHPDLASDLKGIEFVGLYSKGFMRVLPGADNLGRRIISLRPSALTEMQADPVMIRWIVFAMGRLARDPQFQVHGVVLVINYDLVKLADVKYMVGQLQYGRLRLMFHYMRECAPTRIGNIFLVRQPKFFSLVWGLISLFMGKKIRSRVRFLGSSLQELHQAVAPEGLPIELGGSLQQANPLEWLEQQIQDQQQEAQVAAEARMKHAAGMAAISSHHCCIHGDVLESDSDSDDEGTMHPSEQREAHGDSDEESAVGAGSADCSAIVVRQQQVEVRDAS